MEEFGAVGEVDDEVWNRVMEINLNGPFRAMRRAIQIMLPQGSGNIINATSVGGWQGAREGTAYTATKRVLNELTKNTGLCVLQIRNTMQCHCSRGYGNQHRKWIGLLQNFADGQPTHHERSRYESVCIKANGGSTSRTIPRV